MSDNALNVPASNVSSKPVSNISSAFFLLIFSSTRASSEESVIPNLLSKAILNPPIKQTFVVEVLSSVLASDPAYADEG
ncbi:hypothetical protein D3C81_2204280 [compost metagenome]